MSYRVVIRKENVRLILRWQDQVRMLADKRFYREAERGLISAGRKTKTQVQRAVHKQMAMKPGTYQRLVSSRTRGKSQGKALRYEIFGISGGQPIAEYKGLRVLNRSGSASRKFNLARGGGDKGFVRSGVWNAPRTFKRSFGHSGQTFAVLPGNGKAPKILWTYGSKKGQPRGGDGRFQSTGRGYGKLRRLFGGSLMKEYGLGEALATFHRVAPVEMEKEISRRFEKLMRL